MKAKILSENMQQCGELSSFPSWTPDQETVGPCESLCFKRWTFQAGFLIRLLRFAFQVLASQHKLEDHKSHEELQC